MYLYSVGTDLSNLCTYRRMTEGPILIDLFFKKKLFRTIHKRNFIKTFQSNDCKRCELPSLKVSICDLSYLPVFYGSEDTSFFVLFEQFFCRRTLFRKLCYKLPQVAQLIRRDLTRRGLFLNLV